MSILGALFIAGLNQGIWQKKEELHKLRKVDVTFKPRDDKVQSARDTLEKWKEAAERFKKWY